MRPGLVGPGRRRVVVTVATRCRLAIRRQSGEPVQRDEPAQAHLSRSSARARGLQVLVQRQARHCLVGAQLLLPMRKCRLYPHASRRRHARRQDLPRCARRDEKSAAQEHHSLLFIVLL